MASDLLLECRGLSIGYGKTPFLTGIELSLHRGDFLALVGPNGAGKTTLLHTLMGLTRAVAGDVLRSSDLRVGYVPQKGNHDPIFPLTALDVVRGAGGRRGFSAFRLGDESSARTALMQAGVAALAGTLFRQLSGGQQQRVLLARALSRSPDLLALDEPTAGMDLPGERELMDLVRGIAFSSGMAVVLVTHQLWLAARHARRIALVNKDRGQFVLGSTADLISSSRLSEIFGQPIRVQDAAGETWIVAGEGKTACQNGWEGHPARGDGPGRESRSTDGEDTSP